jgi:hypothetical protein
MPASQKLLAERYHTTKTADNKLSFKGQYNVVGLDIDQTEMPNGRYIWFSIDTPYNDGSILLGETVSDYRVKDIKTIRKNAIQKTMNRINDRYIATVMVDRVIKEGGMLL